MSSRSCPLADQQYWLRTVDVTRQAGKGATNKWLDIMKDGEFDLPTVTPVPTEEMEEEVALPSQGRSLAPVIQTEEKKYAEISGNAGAPDEVDSEPVATQRQEFASRLRSRRQGARVPWGMTGGEVATEGNPEEDTKEEEWEGQ